MELVLPLYPDYTPATETTEHTKHVDITPVIGVAGVGKNTLMSLSGIHTVTSDTTRDERENDGVMEQNGVEYFFRGNELYAVYLGIANGEYVQWAPGPNNNIYGSRNSSYPAEGPALIDMVSIEVPRMRALSKNFRSMDFAYIVKEDHSKWIDQLLGRGEIADADLLSRKHEGYESLTFGLEDKDISFFVNDDKDDAAEELRRFALSREKPKDQVRARNCGYAMLRGIAKDLGLPLVYPLG